MGIERFSHLPPPSILDKRTFEAMYVEIRDYFNTAFPEFANPVEGDPIWACIQTAAFVALNAVQQTNDAFLQTQLLYATGANLDVLSGNYNVVRIVKQEEVLDDNGEVEIPEILETDAALRARAFLQWAGIGVGTNGWYQRHALNADDTVKNAQSINTSAGNVTVYVQSETDGGGVATLALQTTVETYLNHETRKILNDTLTIESITTVDYTITAEVEFRPGVDTTTALADLIADVTDWTEEQEVIGNDIPLSRFYAELTPDTVQGVTLTSPSADIAVGDGEVPNATAITITEV